MLIPTDKNVKTVTDLRENTLSLLKSIQKQKEPTIILHHNSPKAVMLSIKYYNQLMNQLEDYANGQLAKRLEKQPKKKENYIPEEQVEKVWTEERRKKLYQAVKKIQGLWADDWPEIKKRLAKQRKIELAASKRRRKGR